MMKAVALGFGFSTDYLHAAGIVSLLSVLVLVGLFYYLNRYTGRGYFSIWTLGWLFYACWLALGLRAEDLQSEPIEVMLKYWCMGASAALLFWGNTQFLKLPSRPTLFLLFIGFLLAWSAVGVWYLKDSLEMQVPIFGTIGLASLVTAFSFYRLRKHREFIGAGLLCFGFTLWGVDLVISPFFLGSGQLAGTGFLISAVLQLFIAVSMIILVLEEARAVTELILNQIRLSPFGLPGLPEPVGAAEGAYYGLFDRAAMNERLRAAYQNLRQSQERSLQQERLQALGQMSRGLAHDINNALTPILGYANLILSSHRDLPEGILNYVRSIKNAGDKIANSVSCIRDFYRKSGGKTSLVPVALNQLISDLVEANRADWLNGGSAGDGRLKLRTDCEADLPQIMGHKSELRGALTQLILNSLQAMPNGGNLELRTASRRSGIGRSGPIPAQVLIEVRDTGIGMDEETRKRCLEPFFSTKEKQGAKGLGLSQVFGVMQRHGGEIEIESQPGVGTIVRLSFPAIVAEPIERLATASADEAKLLRSLKILCVDDEAAVRDVLGMMLKSGGHRVEVFGEGAGAVKALRGAAAAGEPFDLAITDLGMPTMDGHGLARAIRKESPGTPIIMMTGWGDIMKAEGNHPENVDAVVSKPPQERELFEALRTVTRREPAKASTSN